MRDVNVLNVCGGNIRPLEDLFTDSSIVLNNTLHVDRCYFSELIANDAENIFLKSNMKNIYLNHDIITFLEKTILNFNIVTIYRYLEHVSFTNVLYFIYLISRVVKKDDIVDVIVPDYNLLANMLINENVKNPEFEKKNILLTTELLNEPSNPHASIWTPDRIEYFWEFEGRFKVENIQTHFIFDDRDIYLRAKITRK